MPPTPKKQKQHVTPGCISSERDRWDAAILRVRKDWLPVYREGRAKAAASGPAAHAAHEARKKNMIMEQAKRAAAAAVTRDALTKREAAIDALLAAGPQGPAPAAVPAKAGI
jgi:hypothetical protein